MSKSHVILCGGLDYPSKWQGESKDAVRLALTGSRNNVTLKITDISTHLASSLPNVFIDLLEIATYVYCADQATTRGGKTDRGVGKNWRKALRLAIPVREPSLWSSPEITEALCNALNFLSEHEFDFEFETLSNPPPIQEYLNFEEGPAEGFRAEEVVLFSGGLDSFAGAIEEIAVNKRKVALVSHRSVPKIDSRQKSLIHTLRQKCDPSVAPIHIPVWINKDKRLSKEFTQRTRSFLYLSLATAVAKVFDLSRIKIYENGVVSLNLPISAQLVGTRATRSTHPQAMRRIADFFQRLLGEEFYIENPFFWKTKAEIVQKITENGFGASIKDTVSCSRVIGQTKERPHCGKCSQCIDRRFGVLAAEAEEFDPADKYEVDLLTGPRDKGDSRTMLESYIRTASDVDEMDENGFFAKFGEANRAIKYMGGGIDQNAEKIYELYKRHAKQITDVIDEGISKHATSIRTQKLDNSCLIMLAGWSMSRRKAKKDITSEKFPLTDGLRWEDISITFLGPLQNSWVRKRGK